MGFSFSQVNYSIKLASLSYSASLKKKTLCPGVGLWFSSCVRSHLNEPVSSQLRKLQLPLTWPQVPHVYPVLGGKAKSAARASICKIRLQNVSEGKDGTCVNADEQQFN